MPGLVVLRPGDANEVAEAWRVVMPAGRVRHRQPPPSCRGLAAACAITVETQLLTRVQISGFREVSVRRMTIRRSAEMRVKPTHRRANWAEMSRPVTLDPEIEGSNPSSPATVMSQDTVDTCCKTLRTGQRPPIGWQDRVRARMSSPSSVTMRTSAPATRMRRRPPDVS